MNETMRQFWYIVFVVVLGTTNYLLNWMEMKELIWTYIGAMIIIKLTDIQDTIIKK